MRRIDRTQRLTRFVQIASIRVFAIAFEKGSSEDEASRVHVRRDREGVARRADRRVEVTLVVRGTRPLQGGALDGSGDGRRSDDHQAGGHQQAHRADGSTATSDG